MPTAISGFCGVGTGRAIVTGEEVRLRPDLLLIGGETREAHSDSVLALRTVNIYLPPAY
jgi:hypothetical protein